MIADICNGIASLTMKCAFILVFVLLLIFLVIATKIIKKAVIRKKALEGQEYVKLRMSRLSTWFVSMNTVL